MKYILITTKSIVAVVLFFLFGVILKLGVSYYDNTQKVYDFALQQAHTLNDFMLIHRGYYQKLYINKTIQLDQKTLVGLPAYSAPIISKEFSAINSFGITVKTVSDTPRNEKNFANNEEMKAIEYFNNGTKEGYYFQEEEEFFQYATPLFIKEACLQCHGKKEDAPDFIQKNYTEAYDYKLGELRGILSIKIPKETLETYFIPSFFKGVVFDVILLLYLFGVSLFFIKYFRNLSTQLNIEVDRKTKELKENLALLKSYQIALDKSSMVSISDEQGTITYANENFYTISGYTKEEVIGKKHNILRHSDIKKDIFKELWKTIKDKKVWHGIIKNRGKNGDYWIDATIVPIVDSNGNIKEYMGVRHDITKIIEHQDTLKQLANTDLLTGFGNRNKLNFDIENSTCPALALINIDDFSTYNDFYGHTIGDEILVSFANLINKNNCDDFFLLYRLQGDEFALFNPNSTKKDFLNHLEELLQNIKITSIVLSNNEIIQPNVTTALSFEEASFLLQTVDMAYAIAKIENKDILIYSDDISLSSTYKRNIFWSKKIKNAISLGKIVPYFQPIVNNQNQLFEKYESLVRLIEEDGQVVSPYFFLEISKKTKQYSSITKIMIEKSFEYFQNKSCEFSINLTMEDIVNEEMNSFIFELLKKYQIGSRVVFEIVESESIQNYEEVSEFIKKLKSFGCKIAIDDFGSGYSNFEYILKLNVDYLKIDGSLIKNITTDPNAKIVVSTIVDFAKKLGIKTIAEFVENEAIFKVMKELGIDYSQGYYFQAPQSDTKEKKR